MTMIKLGVGPSVAALALPGACGDRHRRRAALVPMSRLVVGCLLVLACRTAERPSRVGSVSPRDAGPVIDAPATAPTPYGAMMRAGARWRFRVHRETSTNELDPSDIVYGPNDPTVDCFVAEAAPIDGGLESSIECEPRLDDDDLNPLSGTWAETPAGLFDRDAWQDDDAPPAPPYLATPPVERDDETTDPPTEHGSPSTYRYQIATEGDAWCATYTFGADRGTQSRLCLDALGPVELSWYREDLEDTDFTFLRRIAVP